MQYPLMSETLLDGNSICQRKRAKSPFSHSPSIKKVKTNPRKEPANYPSHDVKTEPAQSQRANVELSKNFHADDLVKAKPKKRGGRRRIMCSKSKAIQNTESSTALERANSFRSENPFFICAMRKTYIQRSVLFMPGNFITEDQQREDDHVFLWISSERAWHVKFYPSHSSGQILLSIGWMDFVKDNNLKIGDVCVFDQIKKPGISFRVVIFRDTEESSPSKFPDSEFRRCNNEVSENDFTLSISKPCQFYCMYVPKKFIRSHEMDHINEVKLQVGKRSWNVKLDCYGRFTSGLHDFLSQCNVEAGDVCHFELIDKKKFVFEVRVTRCISID
ncbi:B3 domain-containing protein [Glycine soja]|nr:B3 domain-containing protein [Glycine soja]